MNKTGAREPCDPVRSPVRPAFHRPEARRAAPMISDRRYVTIDETARILAVSTATVRNWVKHEYLRPAGGAGRLFMSDEVRALRDGIVSGTVPRLARRANKSTASRSFIPDEYVDDGAGREAIEKGRGPGKGRGHRPGTRALHAGPRPPPRRGHAGPGRHRRLFRRRGSRRQGAPHARDARLAQGTRRVPGDRPVPRADGAGPVVPAGRAGPRIPVAPPGRGQGRRWILLHAGPHRGGDRRRPVPARRPGAGPLLRHRAVPPRICAQDR